MGKVIIETEKLELRKISLEDLDFWHQILSDKEVMKFYDCAFDVKKTQNWIDWTLDNYKRYGFGLWAIILKRENKFIGDCGITMQDIYGTGDLFPEIGYHLNKHFWCKGYASQAAKACLKYGFENFDFKEIFCYQKSENTASRRVAEKIGMSLRDEYLDPQKNILTSVYSITRSEFHQK